MAQREGYSLVSDLSQLNIPFTHHGIGARKQLIRDRGEIAARFLRAYIESIYVFKTNKDLSLKTFGFLQGHRLRLGLSALVVVLCIR